MRLDKQRCPLYPFIGIKFRYAKVANYLENAESADIPTMLLKLFPNLSIIIIAITSTFKPSLIQTFVDSSSSSGASLKTSAKYNDQAFKVEVCISFNDDE